MGLRYEARVGPIAASAALAALAFACDPAGSPAPAASSSTSASAVPAAPQERWTEIVSETAPLLHPVTDDLPPPPDLIRKGELVRVGQSPKATTWKGELLGETQARDGAVFSVQRAAGGAAMFAFESDLGGEVAITSTAALCGALAKRAPFELAGCKTNLRRARAADGAIVSFLMCSSGPCPVALERGDKLGAIALQNLTNAHFVTGKKKSVLVAETRFVKAEGKRTSGSAVVVTFDGADPVRAAEHAADDVDATNPEHVISKVVTVTVTRTEILIKGRIEERKADGTEVAATRPVDERHALPALD